MFKTAEKSELNQISLTGIRSLVLLGLLIEAPRTLEEIREAFINYKIMEEEHSNDILRIDLNTLRAMGCEITRAGQKTNFKYELQKHPFSLIINSEEIVILKKAYNKIKDTSNIYLLLEYDKLFKKLADHIIDNDIKEELLGFSALKTFNLNFIKELQEDCENNRIINLIYKNPSAKFESEKEISAERLVFQNDKIYLYGYDHSKKESIILNIKRIISILSRSQNNEGKQVKPTVVKFLLKNSDTNLLEPNEVILEYKNNELIIEGQYYNNFIATQRILSFGANCIVLEPTKFKENIIQKLKSMRNNYNG